MGVGYFTSNPIINFFTGLVLDDLEDGLKGQGDAASRYRLAHKYGQVYHNNQWKSYYDTYQGEWYWQLEQIGYYEDGSDEHEETKYYIPKRMDIYRFNGYIHLIFMTMKQFRK